MDRFMQGLGDLTGLDIVVAAGRPPLAAGRPDPAPARALDAAMLAFGRRALRCLDPAAARGASRP